MSGAVAMDPLPDTSVVRCVRAGRRFGQRWAVREIDLAVATGEMMGIVGPDGAGKTTLLQMCAAILDPSEGECRVFGLNTMERSAEVTARIGYMSQGFTLYDRLSVFENLRLSAALRDVNAGEFSRRSEALLSMSGLAPFLHRSAGKLSGGMRKKLALCTNLIHEPKLLLLDEPGLGVDPLSRKQLWEMLEGFRDGGTTIVVATSYMDEAERCNRILLLRDGRVLERGTPREIRATAEGRVFEIITPNPEAELSSVQRTRGVYGVQMLPDRLRFQREPTTAHPDVAPSPDAGNASGARPVSPTLEDVFVMRSDHQQDEEPSIAGSVAAAPGRIVATDVSVTFGSFKAVNHVSVEVGSGSMLALIGPNGAGKSTFVRALCGLVPISTGEAYISGLPVERGARQVRQQIGYMSQRFSLYADLTPAENLAFFAAAYGLPTREASDAIRWAATTTAIPDEAWHTLVSELSGATRQRLSLACSILHHPSILFLDEPTSGIDPVARYRFWRLIRKLAGNGIAVVVTTHHLDEAGYCDRIGLMHQGRMVAVGSIPELRALTHSADDASIEDIFTAAITDSQP